LNNAFDDVTASSETTTESLDDDDDDDDTALSTEPTSTRHPLDGFTDAELDDRLKHRPETLGSVSLGSPNAGSLFNGVAMPENEAWKLVNPPNVYGTEETVNALKLSLRSVYEHFPNTPVVSIGHLSAKNGGHLNPHKSHQSGRDVDISFYYDNVASQWYKTATPSNLDLPRTLYLVRTLVEKTPIEMILMDQSLHEPLRRYALEQGLDREWVEGLFTTRPGHPAIIRHAPGHATHLHLRFRSPIAQRSGQRLASLLTKHRLVVVPPKVVTHKARDGETLAKLAARYGTTIQAIRSYNGMKTFLLVAGQTYRIPLANSSSKIRSRGQTASAVRQNVAKK
jgi:penicillin-insensitive murein endopeptidase